MDDPAQLAALVGGGILLVVLVSHLTGGTTRAHLGSADQVQQIWGLDDDTPIRDVQLADDTTAALLTLEDGAHAVVFSLGDRWVSRRVPDHATVWQRGERLVVRLGDFTAPSVRVALADPDLRARWVQRLER